MKKIPQNFPEEYAIGHTIFFGKKFLINENVLIPRLETESLVRRARQILWKNHFDEILDIGSGSGIIGVSVADVAQKITFLDISEKALEIAKTNFFAHFPEKNATFLHSDLLKNFPKNPHSKLLILANLPYIKNNDWKNMSEDTIFEPKIALFGGEKTGFELYEKLFSEILAKKIFGKIIIEFGFDQRKIAEDILQNFHEKYEWEYEFFADYAGIERFAEITISSSETNGKMEKSELFD